MCGRTHNTNNDLLPIRTMPKVSSNDTNKYMSFGNWVLTAKKMCPMWDPSGTSDGLEFLVVLIAIVSITTYS